MTVFTISWNLHSLNPKSGPILLPRVDASNPMSEYKFMDFAYLGTSIGVYL